MTLDVRPGERRAIIGPNGAGKTTLFNLISGELAVSDGAVRLFGRDVTALSPHRRAALGLARTFQITNLFPSLTVLENGLLAAQALTRDRFAMLRPLARFAHLAERVTVLHYGRVVADGPRDVVKADPLVREIYLGA